MFILVQYYLLLYYMYYLYTKKKGEIEFFYLLLEKRDVGIVVSLYVRPLPWCDMLLPLGWMAPIQALCLTRYQSRDSTIDTCWISRPVGLLGVNQTAAHYFFPGEQNVIPFPRRAL